MKLLCAVLLGLILAGLCASQATTSAVSSMSTGSPQSQAASPTELEVWHETSGPALKQLMVRGPGRIMGLTTYGAIARYESHRKKWVPYADAEDKRFRHAGVSCKGDIFGLQRGTGNIWYLEKGKLPWVQLNNTVLNPNFTAPSAEAVSAAQAAAATAVAANLTAAAGPDPAAAAAASAAATAAVELAAAYVTAFNFAQAFGNSTATANGTAPAATASSFNAASFNASAPLMNATIDMVFRRVYAGAGLEDVYALSETGQLYRYVPSRSMFQLDKGDFRKLFVGCRGQRTGEILGITPSGNLWKREPDLSWVEVASGVKDVTMGSQAYILDTDSFLYRFVLPGPETSPRERNLFPLNEKFDKIGSGKGDSLFGIREGRVFVQLHGDEFHKMLGIEEKPVLRWLQRGWWRRIKGRVSSRIVRVAASGSGVVYGLSRSGKVFRRVRSREAAARGIVIPKGYFRWDLIPSPVRFRDIGVSCDGATVWAVTKALHTYRLAPEGRWDRILETLTRVSVGATATEVWGVNAEQKLVLYDVANQQFVVQPGSVQVKRVSGGCDSTVWVVTEAGRLLSKPIVSDAWTERGKGVSGVAHSAGEHTYVLDRRGLLWHYRPPQDPSAGEGKENWRPMHKQLRSVAVTPRGRLYGIDMSWRFVTFRPQDQAPLYEDAGWKQVPGVLDDLCVGSRRHIYGLRNGVLLKYRRQTKTFVVVPSPRLATIRCGCDGSLWGMVEVGTVYRLQDKALGWERVPNSRDIGRVSVERKDRAWGVNKLGHPVEWNPRSMEWEVRKGFLRDVSVSCDGRRFGVGVAGGLWEYNPDTKNWVRLAGGARRVASGGGNLYVVGRVGHLFRRPLDPLDGSHPHSVPFKVIGRARKVSAANDGTVWALDKRGRVFIVFMARLAELAKVPVAPKPVRVVSDRDAAQPDGRETDPFVAGTDPAAVALAKINRHISMRRLQRIVRAPGGVLPKRKVVQVPRPRPVKKPKEQGDNIDPEDKIAKTDTVNFVNLDSEN